ncbi:hypothetical protein [Thiobacillus sp.]
MRHFLIIMSIVMLGSAHAGDSRESPPERVDRIMGADRITAGHRVLLGDAVAGDLIITGSEDFVVAPVGGDLVAACEDGRIDAEVGQDLYTAGGRVTLLTGTGGLLLQLGASAQAGIRSIRGPCVVFQPAGQCCHDRFASGQQPDSQPGI